MAPVLVAAIALCALAVWIVIPPFHAGLLPLTVGVPEISPYLLLVALAICGMAVNGSRATLAIAAAAALAFAYPLLRTPLVLRSFDGAMEQRLGRNYAEQIPNGPRAALRLHALSPLDFLRGIARVDVLVRRGIEFARPQGVPLTVDMYRPASAGPHPILVQLYGGAWQRGSPEDNASFASYFASKGYVVAAIDYRHAPETTSPAQVDDVRAALAWVLAHAAEYEADATRIALLGRSAGAQLALVAAYQAGAPRIRAAVSYYGPTDLVEGWRVPPRPDPLDIRAILETYLRGTPDSTPVQYREASPVTYVSARVPPTLLVYGLRDHIVLPRFGRDLDGQLQRAGATSVLLEVPWADHAFDAVANGLTGQITLYYTERFLAWALR